MDEKRNWATHVLAAFPVSMIQQVVSGIFKFSSLRRNSQIKIEGEEKDLTLFKPAVVNKVDELPGELLVEILVRLPARDLLQLKSVCRSWNATISSPFLVSMHLRNYTNGPAGSASQTLMVCEHPNFDVRYDGFTPVRLFSPLCHGGHVSPQVQYLKFNTLIIAGPCNGIFLMGDGKSEVRIWNPATGKSREITMPPVRKSTAATHYFDNYGFGLDPVAKDFKIVMIRHFWNDDTAVTPWCVLVASSSPKFPSQVVVYTPGTDTWRELEELRLEVRIFDSVRSYNYLNGFFFWACLSPLAALAFDLENEVFRVVDDPVPNLYDRIYVEAGMKQLLVYKDALALFLFQESSGGCDMWLLSEEWRWVKHQTVAPFIPPSVMLPTPEVAAGEDWMPGNYPYISVVGWWRDDELILVRGYGTSETHELVLFDPATQATKVVADGVHGARRVYVNKESLVSVG
ncbi:unnamed protein product [Linum trigynum]|uniref:F-box domain-containing protein n=1 Tax=Linum trigynum TaxID=586398 RepID=A0AAV2D708_9ROSI